MSSTTPTKRQKIDETPPATWPKQCRKARSRFQWTEDDEISLLNAVLDISSSSLGAGGSSISLFQRIETCLRGCFSRDQLVGKIKELKRWYRNLRHSGTPIASSHDQKLFEICEKIWGIDEILDEEVAASDGECNQLKEGDGEVEEVRDNPATNLSESKNSLSKYLDMELGLGFKEYSYCDIDVILREGSEWLDGSMVKEMKEQWRLHAKRELEIFIKRFELVQQIFELIMKALNDKNSRT